MEYKTGKDDLHHDVAGEDILARAEERFREYREKWESQPREMDPGTTPLHLDIEVTSYCNLACPFCATTYSKHELSNGYMSWETVKSVLDQAEELGVYACKFNFRGEPLLHKELGRFIRYAKEKGIIDVFFNTNAALLTEERARELIESGLDRLTVSFDTVDPSQYERYRVGAKFDAVVANVERLVRLRDEMGSQTPKVRVQAVLVPEVAENFDAYVEFWKDRVDQVSYNDMLDNVPGHIPALQSKWVCPFPYQRLNIMWDGTVTTCYNDHYGKNALGHVSTDALADIWREGLKTLRADHREGRAHLHGACVECPLRFSEMVKLGEASMDMLPDGGALAGLEPCDQGTDDGKGAIAE